MTATLAGIGALAVFLCPPSAAGETPPGHVVAPGGEPVVVDVGERAYLGVRVGESGTDEEGARVTRVVEGSPAERAGIRVGDLVVDFGGTRIRRPSALTRSIRERSPGDEVRATIVRQGERVELAIELGRRPGLLVQPIVPPRLRLLFDRPQLGVQLVETTPELREHLGGSEEAGVLVSKVLRGTPAARAGILVGDLIVSIDGRPVADVAALRDSLVGSAGKRLEVAVVRDGKRRTIPVEIPDPDREPPTGPRV